MAPTTRRVYIAAMPRPLVTALLLAALGCRDKDAAPDTDPPPADRGPEPWLDLAPVELDPFRRLADVAIEDAVSPTRLVTLDRRALTFALDTGGGHVHVLDARYHHSADYRCLPLDRFEGFEVGDRGGDCPSGDVELNRGSLDVPTAPAAIAVDEEAMILYAVSRAGALYSADADVLSGDPFDYLRLDAGTPLDGLNEAIAAAAVVVGGVIWLGHDDTLSSYTPDGALLSRETLPGEVLDVAAIGGAAWALTDAGLVIGGAVLDVAGQRIAPLGDAGWIADVDGEQLVEVSGGAIARAIPAEGLTGAIAADPSSGRIYAGVTEGVAVFDSAEIGRYEAPRPVALAATASHEIVLLAPDGQVSVFLDEQPLAGGDPLDVVMVTFVEKPRSPDEELPCRSPDEPPPEDAPDEPPQSVADNAARAAAQRPLLDDLPAPSALAITPHAARRMVECDEEGTFRPIWDAERTEIGALFHDECEECGDSQSAHEGFMAEELADLEALGLAPSWVTGLSPHLDDGLEWAGALQSLGAPTRHLFFSASILPEIPHHTDPRAKDPYPVEVGQQTAAWRIDSAEAVSPGDPAGGVTLYPGDSVAAFTQGGCANLLTSECGLLNLGGGQTLEEDDLMVLSLLLHRALAARTDGVVDTWSFHLPDVGSFDYINDCEETERLWSGADCQAERLQRWMFDVHQRFVLGGLARWSMPADLDTP